MASVVLSPALQRIVDDEAEALLKEFGAGAALFVNGQHIDAVRSGHTAAALFWSALLETVNRPRFLPQDTQDLPAVAALPTIAWCENAALAKRWAALHGYAARRARVRGWWQMRSSARN